ncbi:MAG: hypothetical protein IKL38_05425 [Firmicutes bacterium]|nr:hypothetical protein [Bacillota bacterium]
MRIIKYFGLSFVVFTLCFFQFGLIIGEAQPVITEEYDTLENQTVFLGTAETDTQIQCSVYTVDEENQTTLLYQMSDVVGASGVYQLTVPLPVLGKQYVMLRIGEDECTYAYHRYRKQLATELQEYYLNVYQVLTGDIL